MWVELLPRLSAAGYRCLAPDQRGYSPGARPTEVAAYSTDNLVADVAALAEAAGISAPYHLVGHDWGAGVGWRFVASHADRLASWTALSIPHPGSYGRAYAEDPDQQQRSQYITFFQQAGAAEEMLLANDAARSLAAGHIVANESEPQTIADGARTVSVGAHNWAVLRDGIAKIIEVPEENIKEAVRLLFFLANLKAEPTGALAVATTSRVWSTPAASAAAGSPVCASFCAAASATCTTPASKSSPA